MSSIISSLTGGAGGFQGTGAAAPTLAPIRNPIDPATIGQQYALGLQGQSDQNTLLNALQQQGGLANQASVYNQLQGVANGTGPNPAQAMLNNTTGQNISNQAALMAGQRGAAANPALLARQAAMQGGALQQQSAGQAAALQANQSLNAMNQLGGIANTQVANQIGQTNQLPSTAFNAQNNLISVMNGYQNAMVVNQSNVNSANAGLASSDIQGQDAVLGGLLGGAGAAAASSGTKKAEGGLIEPQPSPAPQMQQKQQYAGPKSSAVKFLSGNSYKKELPQQFNAWDTTPSGPPVDPKSLEAPGFAKGGKVPAMVSPGERYLPPHEVKEVAKGKKAPLAAGEKIPGTPKYPGNDYRNDVVPKTLDAGGIVIPNKVLQSKDPHKKAAKFVAAVLAKKKQLPAKR